MVSQWSPERFRPANKARVKHIQAEPLQPQEMSKSTTHEISYSLYMYMRSSLLEHEKMLTTTDFIFSYLCLQVVEEAIIFLEGQVFEWMY
jgi:hypothetical protein